MIYAEQLSGIAGGPAWPWAVRESGGEFVSGQDGAEQLLHVPAGPAEPLVPGVRGQAARRSAPIAVVPALGRPRSMRLAARALRSCSSLKLAIGTVSVILMTSTSRG